MMKLEVLLWIQDQRANGNNVGPTQVANHFHELSLSVQTIKKWLQQHWI